MLNMFCVCKITRMRTDLPSLEWMITIVKHSFCSAIRSRHLPHPPHNNNNNCNQKYTASFSHLHPPLFVSFLTPFNTTNKQITTNNWPSISLETGKQAASDQMQIDRPGKGDVPTFSTTWWCCCGCLRWWFAGYNVHVNSSLPKRY